MQFLISFKRSTETWHFGARSFCKGHIPDAHFHLLQARIIYIIKFNFFNDCLVTYKNA
jgi:hypothetical protein